MEKTIEFIGPFGFTSNKVKSIFREDGSKNSGIYIWAIEQNGFFSVFYVGISGQNIMGRQITHMTNYLGGQYTVVDAEALKKGNFDILYSPANPDIFLSNYFNYSKKVYELLDTIRLFYCTIDSEKRILERIEGAIIDYIKSIADNKILDVGKYSRKWQTEEPLSINLRITVPTDLPDSLIV